MAKKDVKKKNTAEPAISIIIAMYNMEKYIKDCLNSILGQKFQDYEIIIADDCSTDNSASIVKSMMPDFDGKLKMVKTSKNSGFPSVPKNLAINHAKGKYITILDSDDMLTPTALEDIYKIAEETQAEVVHAEKYYTINEMDNNKVEITTFQNGPYVEKPTLETDDIGKRIIDLVNRRTLWWTCNKLFRRDLIVKNNIKFPIMTSFEDLIFIFCCLACAKIYVRVPNILYIYRIRSDSLSHKGRSFVEITQNMIEAVKMLDKFMNANEFFIKNPQFRYAIYDFWVQGRFNIMSSNIYKHNPVHEIDEYFRKHVFNVKPNENVALMTYFFNLINRLTIQVNSLKQQLGEAKKTE